MKKTYYILAAAMLALSTNLHAQLFVETKSEGVWSDPSIWNWRNGAVVSPSGYPDTNDTSEFRYVVINKDVTLDANTTVPRIVTSKTITFDDANLTLTGDGNTYFTLNSGTHLNIVNGTIVANGIADNPRWNADDIKISFGGFDETNAFYAAKANQLVFNFSDTSKWVGFQSSTDSELNFYFDNNNLSAAKTAANAIVQMNGRLAYLNTPIYLDFSNVLAEDLNEGSYYVSLISYGNGYFNGNIKVENLVVNTTLANGVAFEGLELDNTGLYAKIAVSAVPEPATYAAIFGALALAFAAYRRRK